MSRALDVPLTEAERGLIEAMERGGPLSEMDRGRLHGYGMRATTEPDRARIERLLAKRPKEAKPQPNAEQVKAAERKAEREAEREQWRRFIDNGEIS